MSAQFKPGDPVWIYPAELDGKPAWAVQRQTTVTEPEDKDDLYVEPEPLKEGDWVQVWAQVADPNFISEVDVEVWRIDDSVERVLTRTDAIVRPDAGDLPPWLTQPEVEEPLGLGAVVEAGRPEFVGRSHFVRRHPQGAQPWQSLGNSHYAWSDLKDPKVLSEGWNEGEK